MLLTTSILADFILLCSFLLLALHLYTSRKFNYWKQKGIPYLEPTPFFGNLTDVLLRMKKPLGTLFYDVHASSNDPYTGIFIVDKPALIVRDPEVIKSILVKDFDVFNDRGVSADNKHDTLGSQILFLMKNPSWAFYRKKMTPAFTSGKMKSLYHLVVDTGKEFVDYLNKEVEKSEIVECKDVTRRFTTELITSTAFGLKAYCFEDNNSPFLKASGEIFNFNRLSRAVATTCYIIAPALVKLFRLNFVDQESESFLRQVFWDTIDEREQLQYTRNDFIDTLLQIRKTEIIQKSTDFDGDKLLAQAVIFFLAGYDTTSTTVTFCLYELAKNQETQKKLRAELNNYFKLHGTISYDSINTNGLPYLDLVFKEATRKYPSLPFLDRMSCQDYTIPGTDIVIDKGVGVYISLLGLHMDPENFPNPEEFIPERFSEENKGNIKPYTYMPFGEGPRNCLGYRFGTISAKTAIASVIQNFEVEVLEDTPRKIDFDPKAFVLAPSQGKLPLKFRKIKH